MTEFFLFCFFEEGGGGAHYGPRMNRALFNEWTKSANSMLYPIQTLKE